jgi:hypothetical protein
MYHPITCLEALKKHINPLSKNSTLSGQELQPVAAEHEAELLFNYNNQQMFLSDLMQSTQDSPE